METTNIYYTSTYFDFNSLANLNGETTYESIQDIKYEIKANIATLKANLGRVNNGNLGIMITPQKYTRIHATSYVRLQKPTTLNFPQGSSQHLKPRINYYYVDERRQWWESIETEKVLIKKPSNQLNQGI